MLNEYKPHDVSPPGETIYETMQERNMTIADLAEAMGMGENTVRHLIKGTAAISTHHARCLEKALSVPAEFWLIRESVYRSYLVECAMEKQAASVALRAPKKTLQAEWL